MNSEKQYPSCTHPQTSDIFIYLHARSSSEAPGTCAFQCIYIYIYVHIHTPMGRPTDSKNYPQSTASENGPPRGWDPTDGNNDSKNKCSEHGLTPRGDLGGRKSIYIYIYIYICSFCLQAPLGVNPCSEQLFIESLFPSMGSHLRGNPFSESILWGQFLPSVPLGYVYVYIYTYIYIYIYIYILKSTCYWSFQA